MKLICLNVWGGARTKLLTPFLQRNMETDFFLFQEMYDTGTGRTNWGDRGNMHLFEDCLSCLPDHNGYFAPAESNEFGLAGFIKKGIPVTTGDVFVHRYKNAMQTPLDAATLGRNLQYFDIGGQKPFTLLNFHGLWTGKGKEDTYERLEQSRKIKDFAEKKKEFVLAGDFNLMPETESVRILESMNVRNLISEFGITNTRTSFYTKPDKFADYTFVTRGIQVKEFQILEDEVSDHAAMFLEFDIQ